MGVWPALRSQGPDWQRGCGPSAPGQRPTAPCVCWPARCPVRCRRLWRLVPSQTHSSPRYAWAPTPWQEGPRNRNSIEVRREEKPPGLPLTSSEDGGSCLGRGGQGWPHTAVGLAQLCLPARGTGRDGSVCPAGPPDAAAQGGGLPQPPLSPAMGMHSCLAAGARASWHGADHSCGLLM